MQWPKTYLHVYDYSADWKKKKNISKVFYQVNSQNS